MDKTEEKSEEKAEIKNEGGVKTIKSRIGSMRRENNKEGRLALLRDVGLFALGFLYSRCHLAFGARGVGIALVALMPTGIWPTAAGVLIGSLTMGIDGVILGVAAVVTLLLRAAVSSGDRDKEGRRLLFCENLLTRMAIALLGGFIAALHRVITRGLDEVTLCYGLVMIIITPILTFALSGLFSSGISREDLLHKEDILCLTGLTTTEKYNRIFFQISAVTAITLISLSLSGIGVMGISISFVFSCIATLLVAKRFGAIRGATVGFMTTILIDPTLAVSFALMGVASAITLGLGHGYGIILGGVAISALSGYTEGMGGLLSTLPEYMIGAAIALPLMNKLDKTEKDEAKKEPSPVAYDSQDMVGTMALVYQNKYSGCVDALPSAMRRLAGVVEEHNLGGGSAEAYRLMGSLMEEAMREDDRERRVDNSITKTLNAAAEECEFFGGTLRAFGDRRRYFILAGEDEEGDKISSFQLRKTLEGAVGVRLGTPEYYRRGKMVLMECGTRPSLTASYAIAGRGGRGGEVSGDSAICFETAGGYFYSVIADGMGSGELARQTSSLVCDYLREAMEIGAGGDTLMHMMNRLLVEREEECSSTVDLLKIDLINKCGEFLKSGAAPSYVKRDRSIFRIRSQTAPIGLLSYIDSERIRIEIKAGDHIIMISDGIADPAEDAPWLLLLLGEPPMRDLNAYASHILAEAEREGGGDDMTVTVIRIDEAG